MKEIFLIKMPENEFINQHSKSLISVPNDCVFRACSYIGCLDSETLKINYLTKVIDIKLNEETDISENNSDDKSDNNIINKSYCLYIKPGQLIKLPLEVDLSSYANDLPNDLTFEQLFLIMNKTSNINFKTKKFLKKEVSLLVARYLEQGINFSLVQKFEEAQTFFDLALDIDSRNYLVYFYLGNVYVDKANFDLAVYYYRKSIELNSNFHHAFNYLGLSYYYMNKFQNAAICWQQSININPKDEFALVNLGKVLIQQKKYNQALEILKVANEVNSSNYYVLNLIGVANANLGNLDVAIENWQKIIEAGQDDEYLHLNLARAYFEAKRYREALEEYELLLEMFPKEHDMHKLAERNIEILKQKINEKPVVINTVSDISPYFIQKFGISLPNIDEDLAKKINLNKLADYIELFDIVSYKIKSIVFEKENSNEIFDIKYIPESETLVISPDSYKTTIKLRKALRKVKSLVPKKEEGENIKNNEETKDNNAKEQINIRQIQVQNNDKNISNEEIEEALEQAKMAVQADPHNEWTHYSLGSILAQIGNFKDAANSFLASTKINSNNAIAWYALGLCYVRMNQLDDAIHALQQAIISIPDAKLSRIYEEWNYKDSLAYFSLGDVYIRKGLFDEAIKIFQKGLSIDATSATAHFQLGTCYEVKGQLDAATESFLNCLSLNPNFSYAYSKLGIVYYKKEMYNEALVMLLKAINYENVDVESYYFLGEVYQKLGKIEEAKQAYLSVLQLTIPEDIYYAKAQQRINELSNLNN